MPYFHFWFHKIKVEPMLKFLNKIILKNSIKKFHFCLLKNSILPYTLVYEGKSEDSQLDTFGLIWTLVKSISEFLKTFRKKFYFCSQLSILYLSERK